MTAVELLILSLACWRVAFLVTNDTFPFSYVRQWSKEYAIPRKLGLDYGLSCIRCVSVWAAILTFLLWFTPLQPIVYIAAISGGSLMLHMYSGWYHVQSNANP